MSWAIVAGAAITTVGGSLLGDSGGSEPSVTTQNTQTPEQQAALKQLLEMLTGRSSATTPYGGPLSAGTSPGMARSLAALEQQAMNEVGAGGEGQARDVLSRTMADEGTDFNAYFDKSVADPAIKQFNERILPEITRRFSGNAAFGSDRQDQERKAAGDLSSSLAGGREKFAYDSRESAKNRALTAAGMAPGLNSAHMDALFKLFGAQAGTQQLDQQGLDRTYGEFQRQEGGRQQNIQQILAALGLNPNNTVVNPGSPGFLNSMAPGFGNAAGAYLGRYLTTPRTPSSGGGGIDWSLDSGMG